MKLTFSKDSKLLNVQEQFSESFPNLKIVFYDAAHVVGQGTGQDHELDHQLPLESMLKSDVIIDFNGEMRVCDFEKFVFEETGISVQVFRKSKNAWLQTIATDQWSLNEQQAKSIEMEHPVIEDSEIEDYHEQE